MSSTSSLSFAWNPWSIAIAILAVLITLVVSAIACHRSRWRRSTVTLECFRLAIVSIAAVLLGGPEWVQQFVPDQRPVVAVLWDDSGSMETRDTDDAKTRREAIEKLTQTDTWQSVSQRADVVIESFSDADRKSDAANPVQQISNSAETTSNQSGTNLASPLLLAASSHDHLLAVVLASDGDWNQGDAPVQAAARLRSAGVPVFAFPVGSETRLPDLDLISFDVPTFAVAGKPVRIPLTIESSLPRDHAATLTMETSTGETITHDLRIAAMGRTNDSIEWEPEQLGDVTLTLTLPKQADETIADNNQFSAPISVREEKLQVLVIESLPRWEYRYLRNALSRDPGIEVSCLLFHPGLDKRGGGNTDYIKEFPATKDELADYDVVFLGDVGIDDGQMTAQQCEWIKGLVEQQASGLVFLPGWQGRQFGLLETELADLMPVDLDAAQPEGWGSRTPQHFELTQLGRRSLLTKLADTADENLEVWNNLPGFQWYAPVVAAKPGTETLCVHQEMSNRFGRLPLLVTRTYGAGKVLFMGTDGAWRWRKGVEDRYHYRFWGQVVRWMAYRRNMASGDTMRLYYSPEQPQVRKTVTLNANVMEASGEPLSDGNVTLRVVPPSAQQNLSRQNPTLQNSARQRRVRFQSTGDQWGAFSGTFTPTEPGEHQLTLFCKETGDSLETTVFVQGAALEQVGKPARPEVLAEIARVSRGQVMSIDRIDDVAALLAAMPDPPPSVRRMAIWSHPVVVAMLVAFLAVFWIGRKVSGLI